MFAVFLVLFSVDDHSLFPVNCVTGFIRMVGECWLAIFRQIGCVLISGKSSFGLGLNFGLWSYVEKVLEAIVRIIKKQCTCGHETLEDIEGFIGAPEGQTDKEDITECVHKVPCANCDKIHVGETGRKLGVRLYEHKTEVESKTKRAYTRSQSTASLTEYSKSALTDHAPCESSQSHNRLEKDYGHRQRTRPSYQVDQGSCTYPQGRSSSYESRRGQLPVESRLRPLSWCDSWSSHQDSEELSTSFFWW